MPLIVDSGSHCCHAVRWPPAVTILQRTTVSRRGRTVTDEASDPGVRMPDSRTGALTFSCARSCPPRWMRTLPVLPVSSRRKGRALISAG